MSEKDFVDLLNEEMKELIENLPQVKQLKTEVERLTEEKGNASLYALQLFQENEALKKQVNELTKELANERNAVITFQESANAHRLKVGEVMKENAELQKQVDELNFESSLTKDINEEFVSELKEEISNLHQKVDELTKEKKTAWQKFKKKVDENTELSMLLDKRASERAELQKQVDELKEKNKQLIDDGYIYQRKCELLEYDCEYLKNHKNDGIKQTVKDTAPLAIQRFINQLYIDRIITDSDLENEMLKVKSFVLKRYYGVEME